MAARSRLDPRELLGVGPDADPEAITAAFRREAKRWHPDRGGGDGTADRMALINAAYAELRAAAEGSPGGRNAAGSNDTTAPPRPSGEGLDAAARRALGSEMASVLDPDEQVELVTATATWASPQSYLAVTDRRLVWLLDDAPVHRVRALKRSDVRRITRRPARFWRGASVTIEDHRGRRFSFGELPAPTADALVRRVGTSPQPTRRDAGG